MKSSPRFTLEDGNWCLDDDHSELIARSAPETKRPEGPAAVIQCIATPGLRPADAREHIELKLEIARLERENALFRIETARLATEMIGEIVAATTQLFQQEVSIYESFDPEFPQDKHVVLAVDTPLSTEQIIASERKWILALHRIAPSWDSIRLLIRQCDDGR